MTLKLVHDTPIAGHPVRDKILSTTRRKYNLPTLRVNVERYVTQCVICTKHNGAVKGPAPILQYPVPVALSDVANIDLLQLPLSHYGSRYLLMCVDQFSRFLVSEPLKDKTATRQVFWCLFFPCIFLYTCSRDSRAVLPFIYPHSFEWQWHRVSKRSVGRAKICTQFN